MILLQLPAAELPHVGGYRFIGIFSGGEKLSASVAFDDSSRLRVSGSVKYDWRPRASLVGWFPLSQPDERIVAAAMVSQ